MLLIQLTEFSDNGTNEWVNKNAFLYKERIITAYKNVIFGCNDVTEHDHGSWEFFKKYLQMWLDAYKESIFVISCQSIFLSHIFQIADKSIADKRWFFQQQIQIIYESNHIELIQVIAYSQIVLSLLLPICLIPTNEVESWCKNTV